MQRCKIIFKNSKSNSTQVIMIIALVMLGVRFHIGVCRLLATG